MVPLTKPIAPLKDNICRYPGTLGMTGVASLEVYFRSCGSSTLLRFVLVLNDEDMGIVLSLRLELSIG
jgi:hypothetical protein